MNYELYSIIYIYIYIYIYICYGAPSTAFRRKCSDSVLSKAFLLSAVLVTESWATEVGSCPWPQCVNVGPQDKQHSWHTLHSEELAVAFSFEMLSFP